MHKVIVNQCTIELSLIPQGPILIKSGGQGANPTKPDMEFVETYHQGEKVVYLPGSSLKGAIRAHSERILETVGMQTKPFATSNEGAKVYNSSSFIEQIFGSMRISSRVRIEDAYPSADVPLVMEERNSVAIDRVTGATSGAGLFNYQVCTSAKFTTKLHLKNFSLAQLGLIALVLRDLNEGWLGLGYGKSRGMGTVQVNYGKAIVRYPGCVVGRDGKIRRIGPSSLNKSWSAGTLLGAGEFLEPKNAYGFPQPDQKEVTIAATKMALGIGAQLEWEDDPTELLTKAVEQWSVLLTREQLV